MDISSFCFFSSRDTIHVRFENQLSCLRLSARWFAGWAAEPSASNDFFYQAPPRKARLNREKWRFSSPAGR
jgi:hypothetical protein